MYCSKFIRRYFEDFIFDRLLITNVSYNPDFEVEFIKGQFADNNNLLYELIVN
jgi:hypothetical protein